MNDDFFSINLFNDANSDEDDEDHVYRETEINGNGNGVTDESNNNPTSVSGQEYQHQIRHPFPIIHNLSEAMEYLSCSIPRIYEYGNTSESKSYEDVHNVDLNLNVNMYKNESECPYPHPCRYEYSTYLI